MRRAIRTPLAVAVALLVVTAGAVGTVTVTNDDVQNLGDATSQVAPVESAAAWNVSDAYQGSAKLAYAVGSAAYDELFGSPNTEELQEADALETKKEIYDTASVQATNNEQSRTSLNNYLNDTESIALMEGKNAYITALENGSAESTARNRATEAVADYYAVKQKNRIASWNTTATVYNSSRATAVNTTDVSSGYVDFNWSLTGPTTRAGINFDRNGAVNHSVSLVNGSSADVRALQLIVTENDDHTVNIEPSRSDYSVDTANSVVHLEEMWVQAPTDNFDPLVLVNLSNYPTTWSDIETQNEEVQSQLEGFIDSTYESYQQGDINTSDLVDPYLGAREYDPETSDSWTLRTLTAMGAGSPANLSNIGMMNVSADGTTYSGVLMSDGTPENGYVVGETYNASNIQGGQFVAESNGGTEELSGEFTLESAETTDGEQIEQNETVEYETVEYETANTTEFQELQTELDGLTAEINARQDRLRQGGGGGGWLPDFGGIGLGGIGGIVPVALVAGGALLVLTRD